MSLPVPKMPDGYYVLNLFIFFFSIKSKLVLYHNAVPSRHTCFFFVSHNCCIDDVDIVFQSLVIIYIKCKHNNVLRYCYTYLLIWMSRHELLLFTIHKLALLRNPKSEAVYMCCYMVTWYCGLGLENELYKCSYIVIILL